MISIFDCGFSIANCFAHHGAVAQQVVQLSHTEPVVGSNPASVTRRLVSSTGKSSAFVTRRLSVQLRHEAPTWGVRLLVLLHDVGAVPRIPQPLLPPWGEGAQRPIAMRFSPLPQSWERGQGVREPACQPDEAVLYWLGSPPFKRWKRGRNPHALPTIASV